MKENKVLNPDKVPVGKMLAWQTRPISLGAATLIIGYLSIYCTNTLGMPSALVGTLLMASKIFDGITDLFAGWLIDNTNTRWGKARPYELSIIGVWVCMYALFATPERWGTAGKSVWIFIMYTLVWSIFSTLLNAAESPYIIRAFGSKIAITKVSAYGGIIITLGCAVVSISFPMMMASMATSAAGWRKMILIYAIPLLIIGILRFIFVKEDVPAQEEKAEEKVSFKDIFTVIRSNKYMWLLAIASAIPQLIMGMSAATYYYTDVVGDIGKYSTIQMFSLVSLLFMLVFPAMMKKFSAMQIVGIGSAIGLVGYVINFFAGSNMTLLIVGFLLSGVAALPTSYMRSPIVMQIAEYNVSRGLPEMQGTISSGVNFLCKVGQGIGSFLLGLLLSIGGYDGMAATQSDSAIMMIRLLYGLIPAALMLIVIWTSFAFRPLDKMQAGKE